MSQGNIKLLFTFLASTVVLFNGLASSLHMEIEPEIVNQLITDVVTVTCFEDSTNVRQEIVFLELSKKGEHSLVTLTKSNYVKYGAKRRPNMEAEGNINEVNITQSYLRLTIKNPGTEDGGVYVCRLFYVDGFGDLKDAKEYGNMTVDNDSDKAIITHLLKTVSCLEKKVEEQKKHGKEQEKKVTSLEKTVTDQEKQLQEQTNHSKEYEAKVSSEIAELFDKEQYNRQQIQNLTDKDSFVSAFSARYDSKDTASVGDTLVFSQSILDVGHDYDTTTGVFTAPTPGLYVFHLVVLTYGHDWRAEVNLKASGHTVASLFAWNKDYDDQSSVGTVVALQAGDQVKPIVGYITGGNIVNPIDHFSFFSGYLIQLA